MSNNPNNDWSVFNRTLCVLGFMLLAGWLAFLKIHPQEMNTILERPFYVVLAYIGVKEVGKKVRAAIEKAQTKGMAAEVVGQEQT